MRLPEKEGDWELIISSLMLACSIFLVIVAEVKSRQAEAMLKEVKKEVKQTIKEVCK